MIGLDTNILVRFLTQDDDIQASKVYGVFKEAEADRVELYVPILVVLELLWVLESIYNIERSEVVQMLSRLILMPIFKFENVIAIQHMIQDAKQPIFDLSDLLIAHSAKLSNAQFVLTFDQKAAKHKLFELVL